MTVREPAKPSGDSADVVIAGGGPTGLMLAIELLLAGVTPVVLDRLPQASEIPKGNGLFGQIVQLLDYRGLLEPLRAEATYCGPVPEFGFGPLQLDLARLGTSPLHVLALPQRRLEQVLGDRLVALGGRVSRAHELTMLSQRADHVLLDVRGPDGDYQLRARYLVGSDGARSMVRKQAGIGFPGITSAEVSRIGRVRLPAAMIVAATGEVEVPGAGRLQPFRTTQTAQGRYSLAPLTSLDMSAQPGIYIVATFEEDPGADLQAAMTLSELQGSLNRVLGAELPVTEPQWLTRTVGNSRVAETYRADRVLLAGDAAHLFGAGGSLNVALHDAINLGWKLAAGVLGQAPDPLLDSYHAERHAAALRAQLHTRAQKALAADGEHAEALRELVGELLTFAEPLRHVGELIAGSDVRYEMPAGGTRQHSLAGRLAPDIRLQTSDGRTTVAELMRAARPVLLDFSTDHWPAEAAADWREPVRYVAAQPLSMPVPAEALLIRPDGYVAWAAGPGAAGRADQASALVGALAAWWRPA